MWVDFFEAFMLVCFGSAWPFAIAKSWLSRSAGGKSPLFLVIILCGYISGICSHFWRNFSPVVFLYGLNAAMVAIDLFLVVSFRYAHGKLPFSGMKHRTRNCSTDGAKIVILSHFEVAIRPPKIEFRSEHENLEQSRSRPNSQDHRSGTGCFFHIRALSATSSNQHSHDSWFESNLILANQQCFADNHYPV